MTNINAFVEEAQLKADAVARAVSELEAAKYDLKAQAGYDKSMLPTLPFVITPVEAPKTDSAVDVKASSKKGSESPA